jgi:hypothetical protein
MITEGVEFDRWFYGDSSVGGIPIVLERVPAEWREAF